MNVLIVLAHPEPKFIFGAMKDVAVATLEDAGHEVVVRDLDAMDLSAGVAARSGVSRDV